MGVGAAAHPDELRKRLNARQIAQWIAYSLIEPFGPQHEELLHGIRAAIMANQWRDSGSQPAEATDFMPSYVEPEMTPEEIARNLAAWKASWQ